MTLLLIAAALILPAPASASSRISDDRSEWPGCNTISCERRMRARGHAATVKRWRRVAYPYRYWLRSVRVCESGGNYGISTGNGYYGAYQFALRTWFAVGGRGYPHLASPAEQDYRAVVLRRRMGTGPWPVCG